MTAIKNRHDGYCQISPISCTRVLQDPVVAINPKSRLSILKGCPKCAIHKIINKQDDQNTRSYRMFAPDRQHSQILKNILPPIQDDRNARSIIGCSPQTSNIHKYLNIYYPPTPQYRTTEMLDPTGCIAPDKRHSQYWNIYTIPDDRSARSL